MNALTAKQAHAMRHLRPATAALAKAMDEISEEGSKLCDHGLAPDEGGPPADQDCPACLIWSHIVDLIPRVREFCAEFDARLQRGPGPESERQSPRE